MRKHSMKNQRVNQEVHHELANIIRSELKDPRIDPMTSITAVEVAPDLKTCKAYVSVLKIRAMFENHVLGELDDAELEDAMELIYQAKELYGKEKAPVDKSALKAARKLPKKTDEEKEIRTQAIKAAKEKIQQTKEENLAIERAPIIMEDLNKFSGAAAQHKATLMQQSLANGKLHF